MLYYFFHYLDQEYQIPGAGLFQYISFRSGMAIIISLLISMVFGKSIIRYLKNQQVGERVRDLGLKGQKEKEGTPTMGGIIILMSILVPCLLLARLDNIYIITMLFASIWMAGIGFIDDYIKVFKQDKKGLAAKFKVLGQVVLGLAVGLAMMLSNDIVVRMDRHTAENLHYEIINEGPIIDETEYVYVKTTLTNVPFFKGNRLDYARLIPFKGQVSKNWVWLIFVLLSVFIVTAISNGANLTDGIDGLATGTSAIIGATLGVMAYVSGNTIFADYLNILYLPNSGELVIYAACFIGACIGFLWYNSYPAQVFMGDTGSLAIGGIIASMAILLRKELLIPILCGIFIIENLSVVLQVSYFKYTKKKYGEGRRIFRMSPLHHHYQKLGMNESKIVTRFWIVGILLAALTVITLKIR